MKTKVWVSGLEYTLNIDAVACEAEGEYGSQTGFTQQLRLNPIAKADRQGRTLLHEVVHAVDEANKLELTEQQVKVVSGGVQDFLRRNPDLGHAVVRGKSVAGVVTRRTKSSKRKA